MRGRLLILLIAIFSLLAPAAAAQAVFALNASSYTVEEHGNRYANAFVQRTGDLSTPANVDVQVTNLSGSSFTQRFRSDANLTSWPVSVTGSAPVDDAVYNPGRKYRVTIVATTFGTIGTPSSAQVDIIDDEQPPRLSIDDMAIDEGTRSGPPNNRILLPIRVSSAYAGFSIPLTIHSATAKAGIDYVPFSTVAFIAGGETTAFIAMIDIVPDNQPEGDETFTVELGTPSPPIPVDRAIGTITIRDDDGAVGPPAQRYAATGQGIIRVRLSDPAPATETITLGSSNTFLTFPSSVQLPAGSSSADIEIGATASGFGTLDVTLPPSRGGRTYSVKVTVFDLVSLTLDPVVVSVPIGGTASVKVTIKPPPSAPATLGLTPATSSIAEIPNAAVVDSSGSGTILVRGIAPGSTLVSVALPETLADPNAGPNVGFAVTVAAPTALTLTSLSQKSGRASGGEPVKLFGLNLNGRCAVTFGGVPAPSNELPAGGAVNAITPPHDAGVVDVGIRCGNDTFTLPNAFTFNAAPLSVTQLSPERGSIRGGTVVVVRGANLRAGQCVARFGGLAAHTVAWNGTTAMTVLAPPHGPGVVPIALTCGGDTATMQGFEYFEGEETPATISSLSPVRVAPGDRVTLTGARFRLDDVISFDAAVAAGDGTPAAPDTRAVIVPELPPGLVTPSLRDVAGRTATGPRIEITAPAVVTLTQIDARLTAGAEFTVAGSGFRPALTFALGAAVLPPVSMSTTRALFRVPSSAAAGPASFTISDHGTPLLSRAVDITTSGLAVTSVTPRCAIREGGVLATISGNGFASGAMVQFGTTYSTDVAFSNRFTLVAKVPPAFAGSEAAITVINPDGSAATLTNAFTYQSAAEGGCAPRRRGVGR